MHNGKMAASKDIGFHKAGTKIVNFMNGLHNSDKKQNKKTLYVVIRVITHKYSFTILSSLRTLFILPYTHTDLKDDLNRISNDLARFRYFFVNRLLEISVKFLQLQVKVQMMRLK